MELSRPHPNLHQPKTKQTSTERTEDVVDLAKIIAAIEKSIENIREQEVNQKIPMTKTPI